MKEHFKKKFALPALLLILVLLVSCGKTEKQNKVLAEDTSSEMAAALLSYYDENFDPASSNRIVADFNGDGKSEMVTVSYVKNENGALENFIVAYYRIKDGAMQRDWNVIDSSKKGFPSPFEAAGDGGSEGGAGAAVKETLQIFASNTGYFTTVMTIRNGESVTSSYILFAIRNEQVTVLKNLWDPGDAYGGLYSYEDYFYGEASEPLSMDEAGKGKYGDYAAALNGEFSESGFSFTLNETDAKEFPSRCRVAESDAVRLLLSYVMD